MNTDFNATLTQVYCQAPCQVLPNALWKTWAELAELDCSLQSAGGQITRLEARSQDRLLLYWEREPSSHLDPAMFEKLNLALIHQSYWPAVPQSKFTSKQCYFRLACWEQPALPAASPDFHLADAHPASQAAEIANFIDRCYPNMRPTATMVLNWTQHPVYAPDLWVWLMDAHSGIPAGLGIAELDTSIGEGSLEWIQVLPSYRGQNLGELVVSELLRRLFAQEAQFVTVSGRADTGPGLENFYRRCSFQGDDLWWVLRA